MKILSAIKRTYDDTIPLYELIKVRVDKIITEVKSPKWHYFSRIKEIKSYALKLETGRFDNPRSLEDFFACTLVVENKKEIKHAIEIIKNHFDVDSRKPKGEKYTHKRPESFEFDDLRLYVKLKASSTLPKGPIHDVVFEMQIKTFLQHAWSVATHDLIYKSGEIFWARHRVAYQVKALLESAEVSIDKAGEVTRIPGLPETNWHFDKDREVLDYLNHYFEPDQLPDDMIRLAQNVNLLLRAMDLDLPKLKQILKLELKEGRGNKTRNLSPYMVIVQSIVFRQKTKFRSFIKSGPKNRTKLKLLITADLDMNSIVGAENSDHIIFMP